MSNYPLVPGPTSMAQAVRDTYATDFGSPDLDPAFWDDHAKLTEKLQTLLETKSKQVIVASGEGMVAIWGAMKSVVQPGDKVVSVINGVYGAGFADIAALLGADVHRLEYEWNVAIPTEDVVNQIKEHKPDLVTLVHCETPSGILNPINQIGESLGPNGLFLVDFVSSIGGSPIQADDNQIDIGIFAPHKVLSAPPSLAFTSLSEKAIERVRQVEYKGYDALAQFLDAPANKQMPYTANWHGINATTTAVDLLLQEGMKNVYFRHSQVAEHCRNSATQLGLESFPISGFSPTVSVFKIPQGVSWNILNKETRAMGLNLGGSYGPLDGKVFRIGHMGTQANMTLITQGMKVLQSVLKRLI